MAWSRLAIHLLALCYLTKHTYSYIVPSGKEPACLSVRCLNGGTVDEATCQCLCAEEFTGLLCDTEIGLSAWPSGEYALPMSTFGCPELDRFGWTHGYINMTLPASSIIQLWNDPDPHTNEPHMMGPFYTRLVQLNFCVKQNANNTSVFTDKGWPSGDYCIYQSGDACPEEFADGSIRIRGYLFRQRNMGGVLPSLQYGEDNGTFLELNYCCREDGNVNDAIMLPSGFPFMLFKGSNASDCQEVVNMDVTEEIFYMVNEALNWEYSGYHTNVTEAADRVGISYCYYKPTERRECYYADDHGRSYTGRHNTSASGQSCVRWSDLPNDPYSSDKFWTNEREHNYCGSVDNDSEKPKCYIDMENLVECAVPVCPKDADLEEIESGKPAYSFRFAATDDPYLATDGVIGDQSFVGSRPQLKPFLQIDIQQWYEVHAIRIHRKKRDIMTGATCGAGNAHSSGTPDLVFGFCEVWYPINFRQVGSFVSKNQWDFLDYGAIRCDNVRYPYKSRIFHIQCRRPIIGRYVTIRNFDSTDTFDNAGKFYFLEINEIKVIGKRDIMTGATCGAGDAHSSGTPDLAFGFCEETGCGQHMGLMSGDVFDYQISSSSNNAIDVMSDDGRLEFPGRGWCPFATDTAPWFRVDFIVPVVIQGIRIQGWQEGNTRMLAKEFVVKYGNDISKLTTYQDPSEIVKVFETYDHYESAAVQDFIFGHEFMARFITLSLLRTQTEACLKLEVIGCPRRAKRDLRCKSGSIDFGYAELQYHSWWPTYLPENAISDRTHEECLQIVVDKGFTSYSYDAWNRHCIVHNGHRYYREFLTSWVRDSRVTNFAGHRLCFKEITDMTQCGGPIQLSQGEDLIHLRSPSYPLSYGQHVHCKWTILATPGKFIKLQAVYIALGNKVKWNDVTKAGETTEDIVVCSDEVLIYRYPESHITVSHGSKTPSVDKFQKSNIISSTSTLFMELNSCFLYSKSDERNFEFLIEESDLPGCGLESGQCFVTCTSQSAYIGTPGYPSDIALSDTCTWKIQGTFGSYVRMHILNLDIQDEDGSCVKSFIAVYDVKLDSERTLISKTCSKNRLYHVLTSSWHNMQIEFRAGGGHGNGFFGKYELVDSTQAVFNITNDDCLDGWVRFEASCYQLFNEFNNGTEEYQGITWIRGRDECHNKGGYLVSIGSKTEMAFVHYLMTKLWGGVENGAYIGLHKIFDGDDVTYRWMDGSPLSYTAWFKDPVTQTSQPDGLASERCTAVRLFSIHTLDNWHDIACAYDRIPSYICEMKANISNGEANDMPILPDIRSAKSLEYSTYICVNGEIISRAYTCDGYPDCHDYSDEIDCDMDNTTCTSKQFQCGNGMCISLTLFCDFISHCADKSDETTCAHPECPPDDFRCTNGQCISEEMVCDLKTDCIDKSDEQNCDVCRSDNFLCYDQTCIRGTRQCDGTIDCSGRFYEDEIQQCNTKQQSSCTDFLSLGITTDGEYLVTLGTDTAVKVGCEFSKSDGETRVNTIVHHDHEEWLTEYFNVIEEEDIIYNIPMSHINILKSKYRCSQEIRVGCKMTVTAVNKWKGGNNVWHRSDTEGLSNGTCSCPQFQNCHTPFNRCNCTTGYEEWYVVEINEVKEDVGIIQRTEDLPIIAIDAAMTSTRHSFVAFKIGPLICSNDDLTESVSFLCRSGISIDKKQYCLLDYDVYGEIKGCKDLSHLDDCSDFICPQDFAKCTNSYCVPVRFLCDGKEQCSGGEDETKCGRTCPGLFNCHSSDICIGKVHVCDGIKQCPEGDDEALCNVTCPYGCTCDELTVDCINATGGPNYAYPVFANTRKLSFKGSNFSLGIPMLETLSLAELNLSSNMIRFLNPDSFRHLENIYVLDLSYNDITNLLEQTFYSLRNLKVLHVRGNAALLLIQPGAFVGLSMLPSLAIRQTSMTKLTARTFAGLQKITVLNLTQNKITDVADNTFESLNELLVLDIRGNDIRIFSSGIFNGLEHLTELYTDAYMFCCVKPSSVTDENCYPYQDEFSSCADLMREDHLRSFLWIIGCSSLIGNAGVIIYRILYDRKSLKKGHGIFIMNLGFADFFMGIYMLIIAVADTMFRGKYIWNDLYWRNSSICKFAGVLATVSSEASVMFLLLITIDRFVSIKFLFGQITFTKKRAMLTCCGVWVTCLVIGLLPLLPIPYFNGQFYSRSAVCLGLPLTREWPDGWEYSTAIFIFLNFIMFICIVIGQILIYKEVSGTDEMIKSQRRSQDAAIARSLFLVVFSDFLCWFPLGIMGILALSGHHVPPEVYAWAAVFILPINSALNPILYTFSAIIRRKKQGVSRGSRKTAVSRLSSSITKQESRWHAVCESDLFILGANMPYHLRHLTLQDYMKENIPRVRHIYILVTEVTKSLQFLHRRKLLHGSVSEESVILATDKGKVRRAYCRLDPSVCDEEVQDGSEDMEALGNLVRKFLRWNHSSNKSNRKSV